jgi:hypothetical protein
MNSFLVDTLRGAQVQAGPFTFEPTVRSVEDSCGRSRAHPQARIS